MYTNFQTYLNEQLDTIKASGLYKEERVISSPQDVKIKLESGQEVINFCANNYLGLSNNNRLIQAAKSGLHSRGHGMSSVRFICGTQDIHKQLEESISRFFQTEDTILYAACFDANGGIFEPLLTSEDAIISDELNHASIIDGVRLCKAQRFRYKTADMDDLEKKLQEASHTRFKIIVTDGVFSMDGHLAPVDKMVDLANKYNAMVMVDECHSAGIVGETGRGVTEYYDIIGQVEIITGTLGKAFGGAIGGFTTGKKEIIEFLRQRSRPYLFSNSLPPALVASGIEAFQMLFESNLLHENLMKNIRYFKSKINEAGFDIRPSQSAIVSIMLYDALLSQVFAKKLLEEGIYVTGFFYPVVPQNMARIRVQISASHQTSHIEKAIRAFTKIGKELEVI